MSERKGSAVEHDELDAGDAEVADKIDDSGTVRGVAVGLEEASLEQQLWTREVAMGMALGGLMVIACRLGITAEQLHEGRHRAAIALRRAAPLAREPMRSAPVVLRSSPLALASPPPLGDVMTADEVALLLRVDRKTVYDYAGRGEIPCQRLGKRLLFSREAIALWLRSCCKGSSESDSK